MTPPARARSRGLVAIVESNDEMRSAITDLLDAAGFPTVAYATAGDLIVGGRLKEMACAICDINLPDMSGFDLPRELRLAGAALPVILISAQSSIALRNRAKKCGAASYFSKPFRGNALIGEVERVSEALRTKRLLEAE